MNIKAALLGAVVTAVATTTFANDALLTPRALGNQIKTVSSQTPVEFITVTYLDAVKPISPRAQAAQIKVVKGTTTDCNPALECQKKMLGTPRAVTACRQSVTMPACKKIEVK